MADKVLIVDDDISICKLLEKVMHSNELDTEVAGSGKEALELLKHHTYDVILMDIMLGDMEGFDVIKELRASGIQTPVMIVSGRNEDYDSLYGLSIGADDYITKPFRPLVLGAKVKALIRRTKNMGNHSDTIQCGPFTYESSTMRFYKEGEELILSSKESALLCTAAETYAARAIAIDDNAIMVYINRLRSKIEKDRQKPEHIITVRGMGYRFLP